MRFVVGILSGLLGMLGGWFGLAFLVISLAGPDRDGGIAMGAFFQIGPLGAVIGFVLGVWLFFRIGIVRERVAAPDAAPPATGAPPATTRISRPFALVILAVAGGLAWWGWYELIRSPYLTHGYMTLNLQFKLPPGMPLPPDVNDVHIDVREGGRYVEPRLGRMWHGHDGDRQVILASAELSMKTGARTVSLELPGLPRQNWRLDLSSDPDPTPGYTPWHRPGDGSTAAVEMNFSLTADR